MKNTGIACDVIVLIGNAMGVNWKQTVSIPGGMTEFTAVDLPMDNFVVNTDNANISLLCQRYDMGRGEEGCGGGGCHT